MFTRHYATLRFSIFVSIICFFFFFCTARAKIKMRHAQCAEARYPSGAMRCSRAARCSGAACCRGDILKERRCSRQDLFEPRRDGARSRVSPSSRRCEEVARRERCAYTRQQRQPLERGETSTLPQTSRRRVDTRTMLLCARSLRRFILPPTYFHAAACALLLCCQRHALRCAKECARLRAQQREQTVAPFTL